MLLFSQAKLNTYRIMSSFRNFVHYFIPKAYNMSTTNILVRDIVPDYNIPSTTEYTKSIKCKSGILLFSQVELDSYRNLLIKCSIYSLFVILCILLCR